MLKSGIDLEKCHFVNVCKSICDVIVGWLHFDYVDCDSGVLSTPSTVSSSISALAAVTVEDLIKPYTKMSERHLAWTSKGLSK